MIISKKRFEKEVQKRVDEAVRKCEENHWRYEQEQMRGRTIEKLQNRLIECEKKCGIDHPSHHHGETCTASW